MPGRSPSYVECSFLIPIRGDAALSDGSLHAPEQWEWLTTELWTRFGGATQSPGTYAGFYRDPDSGEMVSDESRRFTVAVPRSRVNQVRNLMREACDVFFQKCVYLSISGKVEFIERSSS